MSRFDRHMLWRLLVTFGFFALVLIGVFWIGRSVSLFDRLIRGGHPVMVFLEFTALTLPSLIRTVTPVAVISAALYVFNRLRRDSELTVLLATGTSPWRLARPVLYFGLVVATIMGLITIVLRPASIQQLKIRETELAQDVTAQFLNVGQFMHPLEGVTFYVGSLEDDGAMRGIFLSDRRESDANYTYTAHEAYPARTNDGVFLEMAKGLVQQHKPRSNSLVTVQFDRLTYDITDMVLRSTKVGNDIRGEPILDLVGNRKGLVADGFDRGEIIAELHERLSWPLVCIAIALLGYATMMLGSYTRYELWPQLTLAFVLLILIEIVRSVLLTRLHSIPDLWPIAYAPVAVGIAISVLFLWLVQTPLGRNSLLARVVNPAEWRFGRAGAKTRSSRLNP